MSSPEDEMIELETRDARWAIRRRRMLKLKALLKAENIDKSGKEV